jgi:hypothetical protein
MTKLLVGSTYNSKVIKDLIICNFYENSDNWASLGRILIDYSYTRGVVLEALPKDFVVTIVYTDDTCEEIANGN